MAATSTNYELVVPPMYLSELAVAMALVPLSTIPESNLPVPIDDVDSNGIREILLE